MVGIASRDTRRTATAPIGEDGQGRGHLRHLPWLLLVLLVVACGGEDVAVRGPEHAADTVTAAQELPPSRAAETIEAEVVTPDEDVAASATDATIEDGGDTAADIDGGGVADGDVATEQDGEGAADSDAAEVALACAATDCDDGNMCTVDSCAEPVGCVHLPQPATCEVDGDVCTVDECAAGACAATGKVKGCSDGNPCTIDACKQGACVSVPAPDGAVCKGGDVADLVLIPAGETAVGCTGLIGRPVDAGCNSDETPPIVVYVSAFRIQRHEATAAQFSECVAAGVCTKLSQAELLATKKADWMKADLLTYCTQFGPAEAKLPMNCVTQGQAWTFCQWLGGRFPTFAEYDKAMRGGCETLPPGKSCKDDTPLWPWGKGKAYHGQEGVDLLKEIKSVPAEQLCGGTICPIGFAPGDVSPYGVRDLYGSLDEFVSGDPAEKMPVNWKMWDGWPYKDPPAVKAMSCEGRNTILFAPAWPSYPTKTLSCDLGVGPDGALMDINNDVAFWTGFRCVLPPVGGKLP